MHQDGVDDSEDTVEDDGTSVNKVHKHEPDVNILGFIVVINLSRVGRVSFRHVLYGVILLQGRVDDSVMSEKTSIVGTTRMVNILVLWLNLRVQDVSILRCQSLSSVFQT